MISTGNIDIDNSLKSLLDRQRQVYTSSDAEMLRAVIARDANYRSLVRAIAALAAPPPGGYTRHAVHDGGTVRVCNTCHHATIEQEGEDKGL